MAESEVSRNISIVVASGFSPDQLASSLKLLCSSGDTTQLRKAYVSAGCGTDMEQFLFPLIQPVLEVKPELVDSLVTACKPQPVSDSDLKRYFTEMGPQPLPVFGMEFGGRLNDAEADNFVKVTRSATFNLAKRLFCGFQES